MLFLVLLLTFLVILLTVMLIVAVYRLIQYDNFVSFLNNDIADVTIFMQSLISRDLFSNAPEIIAAHKEFKAIYEKMERYRDILKKRNITENFNTKEKPVDKRPVFID